MSRRNPFPIGERFGRLTVLSVGAHDPKQGRYCMVCRCDCGKECEVREDMLRAGNTKSCGCLYKESRGATRRHGMWDTRTYRIWAGMKHRCTEDYTGQKAHLYAAKGVRVCDRWRESFEAFLEDMGQAPEGHTIDRIDSEGHYEPGNCRWATPREQANNTSRNTSITFAGKTRTIAQWAEVTGIKPNTLVYRIRRNWSAERALTQPVQARAGE